MILLVNDDGIDAPGLRTLYHALRRKTKQAVIAVAPQTQHSGQSHAITLHRGLHVHAVHDEQFFGFTVDGTPCDCVKMALKVICREKPQLVVSGINAGPNVGRSLFYSGTVAAALEAAVEGFPALAVSQDLGDGNTDAHNNSGSGDTYTASADLTAEIAHACLQRDDAANTVINLNMPALDSALWQDLVHVRHGLSGFDENYQARRSSSDQVTWHLNGTWHERAADQGADSDMLKRGHPTMSFLEPSLNSGNGRGHSGSTQTSATADYAAIATRLTAVALRWSASQSTQSTS